MQAICLPTNTDGEAPLAPVAPIEDWHLATRVRSWPFQNLVRVAVFSHSMRVGRKTLVRVSSGSGHLMTTLEDDPTVVVDGVEML